MLSHAVPLCPRAPRRAGGLRGEGLRGISFFAFTNRGCLLYNSAMGTAFSLESLKGLCAHFIGIKGTGMAALAEIFCAEGAKVSGSDVSDVFYTDAILRKIGVHPLLFDAKNITSALDLVVHSSAYTAENNCEVKAALELGLPVLLYSEALGELSRTMTSAAVSGVHGKTTTAGIIGTLLKDLPLPSLTLAGSSIASFGGSCVMISKSFAKSGGKDRFFAAETCEYQRHFMAFCPDAVILTAVESDHEDYYPAFKDIQAAFVDFICKLPVGGTLIYCADDPGARETAAQACGKRPDIVLVPYGETAEGPWRISDYEVRSGRQLFTVADIGRCSLEISGRHNVRNAAAALALVSAFLERAGESPAAYYEQLKKSLREFRGGKRRSEIVAREVNRYGQDLIFIDDYAHHPTAIKTTLEGYRLFYPNHTIIVDFMSHTYSRTAALLDDFARSFGDADMVVLNDIYASARETASDFNITGRDLYKRALKYHSAVSYEPDFTKAAQLIKDALDRKTGKEGYVFVTMGAGDNFKVGQLVLDLIRGGAK